MLTVKDVKAVIADIKHAADSGDYETAHELEDNLYVSVLRAIAKGMVIDPSTCAKEALKTQRLKFARFTA